MHHAQGEQPGDVDSVVASFEASWHQGEQPAIADYLPADPQTRTAILVRLIRIDLDYRLKADRSARVEHYLEQYPELASDGTLVGELIAAEWRLRSRRESGLALDEFRARFPQYADSLVRELESHAYVNPRGAMARTMAGQSAGADDLNAGGRQSSQSRLALRAVGPRPVVVLHDGADRRCRFPLLGELEHHAGRLARTGRIAGEGRRRRWLRAPSWMARQDIRNPARMAAVFAPRFADAG